MSMGIALVNGVRSDPTPGANGVCQGCGAPMTAKCGERNVWHWAHKGRRVCDPWWENEGEWHRSWKGHFPRETHEVVRYDETGEKHISDVLLPSGQVIELQHSAMPPEESRSREKFYGNMIWIVDAEPFRKNIHIFDALPDPSAVFVSDLRFVPPRPEWRGSSVRREGFNSLMFFRRSERQPDTDMQQLHSGREIAEHFPETYRGHRLFLWIKPRTVWFQTTAPTFLDLGDGVIAALEPYGTWQDTFMCLRLLSKERLIADILGGADSNAWMKAVRRFRSTARMFPTGLSLLPAPTSKRNQKPVVGVPE